MEKHQIQQLNAAVIRLNNRLVELKTLVGQLDERIKVLEKAPVEPAVEEDSDA